MTDDGEGFQYPSIDVDACDECGACDVACPTVSPSEPLGDAHPQALAAWCLDEPTRRESSSGGVFSAIAQRTLHSGGAVVGAAYDEAMVVRHVVVRHERDLGRLRGSKYSQSSLGKVFADTDALLESGCSVLFTGTPCQIAGLLGYLGGPRPRLTTVDVVCHGVPSPMVLRQYLTELERHHRSRIVALAFRHKATGWKRFSTLVRFESGLTRRHLHHRNPFMAGFLENLYLRPACHSCPYATLPRCADLTLGDFWGIGRFDATLDDDRGTSLVLLNTPKGKEIYALHADALRSREVPLEVAILGNPTLARPSERSTLREAFFRRSPARPFTARVRGLLVSRRWTARLRRGASRVARGILRLVRPAKSS